MLLLSSGFDIIVVNEFRFSCWFSWCTMSEEILSSNNPKLEVIEFPVSILSKGINGGFSFVFICWQSGISLHISTLTYHSLGHGNVIVKLLIESLY